MPVVSTLPPPENKQVCLSNKRDKVQWASFAAAQSQLSVFYFLLTKPINQPDPSYCDRTENWTTAVNLKLGGDTLFVNPSAKSRPTTAPPARNPTRSNRHQFRGTAINCVSVCRQIWLARDVIQPFRWLLPRIACLDLSLLRRNTNTVKGSKARVE